jgi:2-polyprenyl-3-methyl-5-hydroxy-6-metoxy-1,4-benzoquinol methylase
MRDFMCICSWFFRMYQVRGGQVLVLPKSLVEKREEGMNSIPQISGDAIEQRRDQFVERLLQSTAGVFDIFTVYIGDKLGFYNVLADDGSLTSAELASRTGTHERYVREWLEQQTVAGILEVEDANAEAGARRFYLPRGHDEVLTDRDSLSYLPPLAQLAAGAVRPLPSLLQAFRSGGGVPYRDYGADFREGQARVNRASFLQLIGKEWVPAMPDVQERLQADPPARVADIGCGAGWSAIGTAQSYPKAEVDGFDLDAPSIELARANALEAGLADRVRFQHRDAGDRELAGQYDFVMTFECIHDLSDPVAVLGSMRRLVKENGAVLVVDERVGETFQATGSDVDWMMYGWSVLHCLPAGMADQPSAGTGTVMRPDTLRGYAREAGFRDIEILPIDNFFFRFYRLR